MPLTKLQFRPGIVTDITSYSNEGGWSDCDKIRFHHGSPQKIGGWSKYSQTALNGTCRNLHAWIALDGQDYLAAPTNKKYYIEAGDVFSDITPIRSTTAAGDLTFTTTSGSATIKVNDTNHDATLGDFVTISGVSTAVDGVPITELNAEHEITKINSSSQYEIEVTTTATSGVTNDNGGGSVVGEYQINTGLNSAVGGTGWGAGEWGGQTDSLASTTMNDAGGISATDTTVTLTDASSFPAAGYVLIGTEIIQYLSKSSNNLQSLVRGSIGTTAAAHSDGSTVTDATKGWGMPIGIASALELRTWSHDNFGEDLLLNPRDGSIFYWDKSLGAANRAVDLSSLGGASDTPTIAKQILVSDRDRHIIAFGTNPIGSSDQDPLLIRFGSQESLTDFTPTVSNTAGDLILGSGSTFVQALETKREILVWTDSSLYSMRFVGPPFTFGLELLTASTSIVSSSAATAVEDAVFWMGENNFYMYSGGTKGLDCPVSDHVFKDFNENQKEKVVSGHNVEWSEVWWFYPSAESSENDRYVIYNYQRNIWYFGTLSRTAWLDRGVKTEPIAYHDGYLYNHENGVDDDGSAMTSYIESAVTDLEDGDKFMLVRRLIPDVSFTGSTDETPSLNFTVKTRNFAGDDFIGSETGATTRTQVSPVQKHTQQLHLRLRGRSMSLRVESDAVGVDWKLGSTRIDIRPDGKR